MDFELKQLDLGSAAQVACDALLLLLPDAFLAGTEPLAQLAAAAIKSGDLQTKAGKCLALYQPAGLACRRLVLVGAGDGSAQQLRKAVAAGVTAAKSDTVRQMVLLLPDQAQTAAHLLAAMQAAAEASYVYVSTKSKPEPRSLERLLLGVADSAALAAALAHGRALVAGVELAKEWANRPANHATPSHLAEVAQTLAKAGPLRCKVLGPKDVAKLGMGAFMAVAQGSEQPLRFIVLKYQGAAKTEAPVVLVGKGITFDSGGISLKPGPEMDEMKYDMCGAASVLGVFRALSELRPALNVVGLIPACENLPDARALKPGDVVTSLSGQTIEILNTDAEGRLILCDALTYAERFKPRAVIDIATLTGACVIALGAVRSGLFASDDALAAALQAAGEQSLDGCWRMPLDEDYAEGLKSNFADVANVAGRPGGAVTAAKFLQRFTEKFAWAHLDIAGTAWKTGTAKGATGRPVPLLLDYLLTQAGSASAPTGGDPPKTKTRSGNSAGPAAAGTD